MLSDANQARVAAVLHAGVGLAAGWVSPLLSRALYAVVVALVVLYALGVLSQKTYAQGKSRGWWLGTGALVYLFLWFLTWTVLVNG